MQSPLQLGGSFKGFVVVVVVLFEVVMAVIVTKTVTLSSLLQAKPVLVLLARAATNNKQQLNGLREHISEIFGAVGPHISSLASPVFGTNANIVEPKKFENVRMLSNISERI